MQQLSNAHVKVIVNGNRMTGLAAEDRPYEFPSAEDMMDVSVGADGGVYASSVPMYGGPFTMRFEPSSPSVQYWINEKEANKQAQINGTEIPGYESSYSDPEQGRAATMEGGFLMSCPDMSEPGQTFEVVVYYARITPDVDGAVFEPPTS